MACHGPKSGLTTNRLPGDKYTTDTDEIAKLKEKHGLRSARLHACICKVIKVNCSIYLHLKQPTIKVGDNLFTNPLVGEGVKAFKYIEKVDVRERTEEQKEALETVVKAVCTDIEDNGSAPTCNGRIKANICKKLNN